MYYFCVERQELTSKLYHREKQIGKGSLRQFRKSLFPFKESSRHLGKKDVLFNPGHFQHHQCDECWYHCLQTENRTLGGCHLLVSRPSRRTRFAVQVRASIQGAPGSSQSRDLLSWVNHSQRAPVASGGYRQSSAAVRGAPVPPRASTRLRTPSL